MATHWSEKFLHKAIVNRLQKVPLVISAGVSLSSHVHVGHSRELIIAAIMLKVAEREGFAARLVAFADDLDPLKRVYPFMSADYSQWVGCPLCCVPDPFGCHKNHAEHFLDELMGALDVLHIRADVVRASDLYQSGAVAPLIRLALSERRRVGEILSKSTGKNVPADFWPFLPKCPLCDSVRMTRILEWNGSDSIQIHCEKCAKRSSVDISHGGGKLAWRCDWPMRWAYLGVDIEPCAHDHACAGGSFDTGKQIVQKIYGAEAPVPIKYSWVSLKGYGPMHSSSLAVHLADLVRSCPAELLWWMVARHSPSAAITFDLHESVLEEAKRLRQVLTERQFGPDIKAAELVRYSVPISEAVLEYPYGHLAYAAHLSSFDPDRTLETLRRSNGYRDSKVRPTREDLEKIRNWLLMTGFSFKNGTDKLLSSTNEHPDMLATLRSIREELVDVDWYADMIRDVVFAAARKHAVPLHEVFTAIYSRVLGRENGPKIGPLFETLGREEVLRLLEPVSGD